MSSAQDSIQSDARATVVKPDYVENQPIQGGDTPYNMPRQTGTGNTRGVQNITGYIVVIDPVNNINQIIIGTLPNGDFGIAISKPGVDVFTAFS